MLSMISALAPVGVQGAAASAMRPTAPVAETKAANPGADFSAVMADVSQRLFDNLAQGEAAGIAGVQGKAAVQDVVQAVMSAEQSLTLAMAVRDKVVAAYQQVSQMPI